MAGMVKPVQGGPLTGLAVREADGVLDAVLKQVPPDTQLDGAKLYDLLRAASVSSYVSGLVNGIALGILDPNEAANLVAIEGVDAATLIGMQEAHRVYLDEVRQALRTHLERGQHPEPGSANGVLADDANADAGRA